jgi:hypothetical protein
VLWANLLFKVYAKLNGSYGNCFSGGKSGLAANLWGEISSPAQKIPWEKLRVIMERTQDVILASHSSYQPILAVSEKAEIPGRDAEPFCLLFEAPSGKQWWCAYQYIDTVYRFTFGRQNFPMSWTAFALAPKSHYSSTSYKGARDFDSFPSCALCSAAAPRLPMPRSR